MIPRRLHLVWLGPARPPDACINSWRIRNPGWEVIVWRSETGYGTDVDAMIAKSSSYAGKADIIRMWALFHHGGIAVDADGECVWGLDTDGGTFTDPELWLCRESPSRAPGIFAVGYMGARPGHPFFNLLLQTLKTRDLSRPAHYASGPHFITEIAEGFQGITELPARHFIPWHLTGTPATGRAPIYGRQFWGSQNGYEQKFDTTDPRLVVVSTGVNVEKWVPGCVQSVQTQTIAARHVVVVDDCASLDAAETASYGPRLGLLRAFDGADLRSRWPDLEGLHPAVANLVAAIRWLPKGSIVVWQDTDDFLSEHWALEMVRDRFNADPELEYLQCTHKLWPRPPIKWPDRYFTKDQLRRGWFRQGEHYAHGLRVFRKELFERIPMERFRGSTGDAIDLLVGLNLLELAGEHQDWLPWPVLFKNMRCQPYPAEVLERANSENRRLRNMEPLVETTGKSGPEIVVISTGAKCPEFASDCVLSVSRQNHQARHLIVAGDYETANGALQAKHDPDRLVLFPDDDEPLGNVMAMVRSLDPRTVVAWLDLDDVLLGHWALDVVATAYADDPSLEVTYGSFRWLPSMAPGWAREFTPEVIAHRAYRRAPWPQFPTHLKTFRAGLAQQLTDAELRRPDGHYWQVKDLAIMLPVLELSDGHHKHLPEFLYGYRDWRLNLPGLREMETKEDQAIRALPRVKPKAEAVAIIGTVPPARAITTEAEIDAMLRSGEITDLSLAGAAKAAIRGELP
jgi:hypothetical protein